MELKELMLNGDLSITGELRERSPEITQGLVSFFPLDGSAGLVDLLNNNTLKYLEKAVTISDDGVGLERAIFNSFGTQPLNLYKDLKGGLEDFDCKLSELTDKYLGRTVYRLEVTPKNELAVAKLQQAEKLPVIVLKYFNAYQNNKCNASIYWRALNKVDITVDGMAEQLKNWGLGISYQKADGWCRTVVSRAKDQLLEHPNLDYFFWRIGCMTAKLGETIYIDWVCPQFEQGNSFATSYTASRREPSGTLEFEPNADLNLKEFTLMYSYKPNIQADTYYQNIMNIYDKNSDYYIRFTKSYRELYDDPDEKEVYIEIRSLCNIDFQEQIVLTKNLSDQWCQLFLVKTTESLFLRLVSNNELIVEKKYDYVETGLDFADFSINKIIFGNANDNIWNMTVKDIAIYNRALSNNEMERMSSKVEVTAEGALYAELKEAPVAIPSGALYFPLASGSQAARHSMITAEKTENLIYEKGVVQVNAQSEKRGILRYQLPDFLLANDLERVDEWTVAVWAKPNLPRINDPEILKKRRGRFTPLAIGEYYGVESSDVCIGFRWGSGWQTGEWQIISYSKQRDCSSIEHKVLTDEDLAEWGLYVLRFKDSAEKEIHADVYGATGNVYSLRTKNVMGWLKPWVRLGGYSLDDSIIPSDETNKSTWDGWFRDLMVAKRFVSDAELQQLWDSNLVVRGREVQLGRGQLREIASSI